MRFMTPIYLALAGFLLAVAIIEPAWGSPQHVALVVAAGCASSGVYGLLTLADRRRRATP